MALREMQKQTESSGKVVFQHKKTSKLFEYFTLSMVINIFEDLGLVWKSGWLNGSSNLERFSGEIPAGTEIIMEDSLYHCSIIYDKEVRNYSEAKPGSLLLNNAKNNRPDITVVITEKDSGKRVGIFIVEVKCKKAKNIYSQLADTRDMEQIRDYINFSYKDMITKREQRGKVDKVLLVYPKQTRPIVNPEDNGFIYIQAEADANIKNSIGYAEIKAEIESYFIEEPE